MSIESWRQGVDLPNDHRLVRLGELVERAGASVGYSALRVDLERALISGAGGAPERPASVLEWAMAEEEANDEMAWAAEDRGDGEEYGRCFARARGFGAIREVAGGGDDMDAVAGAMYELFHSVGSSPDRVLVFLRQAPGSWPALAREANAEHTA